MSEEQHPFDRVKDHERDALEQSLHGPRLNYDGHADSCDCAVCDDIAFRRSIMAKKIPEPDPLWLAQQRIKELEGALKGLLPVATSKPMTLEEQADAIAYARCVLNEEIR